MRWDDLHIPSGLTEDQAYMMVKANEKAIKERLYKKAPDPVKIDLYSKQGDFIIISGSQRKSRLEIIFGSTIIIVVIAALAWLISSQF